MARGSTGSRSASRRATGALNPSWSPDGGWIVFSLQRDERAEIYLVHPDGTGLRRVTDAPGAQAQHPDWGTP